MVKLVNITHLQSALHDSETASGVKQIDSHYVALSTNPKENAKILKNGAAKPGYGTNTEGGHMHNTSTTKKGNWIER